MARKFPRHRPRWQAQTEWIRAVPPFREAAGEAQGSCHRLLSHETHQGTFRDNQPILRSHPDDTQAGMRKKWLRYAGCVVAPERPAGAAAPAIVASRRSRHSYPSAQYPPLLHPCFVRYKSSRIPCSSQRFFYRPQKFFPFLSNRL